MCESVFAENRITGGVRRGLRGGADLCLYAYELIRD